MIKSMLVDEGVATERYVVTDEAPEGQFGVTTKVMNIEIIDELGNYDNPFVCDYIQVELWNGNIMKINPERVIWAIQ